MVSNQMYTLDGFLLDPSNTVKNRGVILDQDMSFSKHIKQIHRTASFHLHNISKITNILSQNDAQK